MPIASQSQHPVDILEEASSITCFLVDVAPYFGENKTDLGLSEKGAQGLYCILVHLDGMIKMAIEKS